MITPTLYETTVTNRPFLRVCLKLPPFYCLLQHIPSVYVPYHIIGRHLLRHDRSWLDIVHATRKNIGILPLPVAHSVNNTFTFDVVQVTGSNLTSIASFTETLAARASLKTHFPGSPGNETKRVGQRTVVCVRF